MGFVVVPLRLCLSCRALDLQAAGAQALYSIMWSFYHMVLYAIKVCNSVSYFVILGILGSIRA